MKNDKASLRKNFLALRAEAHAHASASDHAAMEKNMRSLPAFANARTLLLYASKDSEAPTLPLASRLLSEGKRVAFPITHLKEKTLALAFISSLDDLVPSSFGVPEPKLSKLSPCAPSVVQAAILPGLAFDAKGNRLGYGLGFYDRFLSQLSCPLIGLAYEAQISDSLPHDAHDVPVDFVVTEKRIIDCQPKKTER